MKTKLAICSILVLAMVVGCATISNKNSATMLLKMQYEDLREQTIRAWINGEISDTEYNAMKEKGQTFEAFYSILVENDSMTPEDMVNLENLLNEIENMLIRRVQ